MHSSWSRVWVYLTLLTVLGLSPARSYGQDLSERNYRSGYFIGNSLTWNSSPQYIERAFKLRPPPKLGWAIYPGWPLERIARDASIPLPSIGGTDLDSDYVPYAIPTSGRIPTGSEHLQKAWDFLSVQPHYADYDRELSAAIALIKDSQSLNPNNAEADVFLFHIWPFGAIARKRSFAAIWEAPTVVRKKVGRNYFQDFHTDLKAAFPHQNVFAIPVGDVLAELDRRLKANPLILNGSLYASAWDLFEDDVHLSDYIEGAPVAGEYVAHMTLLVSIWGGTPADYVTFYHGKLDASYIKTVDAAIADIISQ